MDPKKFRIRFVVGAFIFILTMAALGWVVGDSYLLAVVGIAGWLVFVGLFIRYLNLYRKDKGR